MNEIKVKVGEWIKLFESHPLYLDCRKRSGFKIKKEGEGQLGVVCMVRELKTKG